MKIYNYSRISFEKKLWHEVKNIFNFPEPYRDSELFEKQHIIVVIGKEKSTETRNKEGILGEYSCGRINIYPCPNCTEASIFLTYIHELMHHFVYEFHNNEYFKEWTENFCQVVAWEIFHLAGGYIEGIKKCSNYHFKDEPNVQSKINKIAIFVRKINIAKVSDLKEISLKITKTAVAR